MRTTRREFLKKSSAALLLGAAPHSLSLGSANAANIQPIFDAVVNLTGNSSTSLKILYPQGSINNIQPVAEAFSRNTNVTIVFEETTVDDINLVMLNGAAAGNHDFDIALPATFGIPDLAEANAIADLSEYVKKYEPSISCGESLYSLGDTYKGRRYGYQTDGDVYLMFYNNEHLTDKNLVSEFQDKFGIAPEVPKTWQELDQMMEFFHAPDKNRFGGCMFRTPTYVLWEWWIRMHALGGLPVNDDFSANVASDAGVEALENIIRATEFQHPSVDRNGLFDNWRVYAEGNCFANIGWGGTQKYLNSDASKVRDKLRFTPTPQVSYFNWGWDYVVSNFSEKKELAYLFCLFTSLPETSTQAVRGDGFFDPFQEQHYEDPEIVQAYSKPFLDAHRTGMRNAIPDFYVEGQGRYMSSLRENIKLALDGVVTSEQALKFTDLQWNKITDEIGSTRQASQWARLKESYPK